MKPAFSAMKELISASLSKPALSIILPFDPKMTVKAALNQSIKIAMAEVEEELINRYTPETVELMMDKLSSIVTHLNFSTHKKSIAIYLSPVFEKVLYLDIDVQKKIFIDGSFEIRELVYNKKELHQYLVLMLSERHFGIFLGDEHSLTRIVSNSPSLYSSVNDVPFLHEVDNSLNLILKAYRLPLFVLGAERIVGHFKQHTKHVKAIVGYLHGNYEKDSTTHILKALQPLVHNWKLVIQQDLLNQLEDAAGRNKLALGIKDVWKEATDHKGRLLVVEKDYMCDVRQGLSNAPVYMPAKRYNKFSNVKDAVDEIIQTVLESGGDVEFVDSGMLNAYDHIALVKYY